MQSELSAYQIGQIIGGVIGLLIVVAVPLIFIVSLILLFTTKKKAWLFAIIPSGLLSLVVVGLFAVAFVRGFKKGFERGMEGRSENVSAEKVPADRLVTSTDGLVQMKLPMHWRILKNLNDEAQLQAGNLAREEYLAVINELKADFSGTLEEYGGIIAGNLEANVTNATLSGPEKVVVNGLNGLQYRIAGTINNVNVAYLLTVIESTKGFHQINQWTLQSKEDKAFPVFREVLQSFVPVTPGEETAKEN